MLVLQLLLCDLKLIFDEADCADKVILVINLCNAAVDSDGNVLSVIGGDCVGVFSINPYFSDSLSEFPSVVFGDESNVSVVS